MASEPDSSFKTIAELGPSCHIACFASFNSARTVPAQCPHSARTVPDTVPDCKNIMFCIVFSGVVKKKKSLEFFRFLDFC